MKKLSKPKRKTVKHSISAEDICRLKMIGSCTMSPDEKHIAYTVEITSDDKKKYFSHIYIADISTGESKRYTYGDVNDSHPVWSPDGRYLAFISARNKKSGIYIMPTEGGAERKVIEKDGAFMLPVWTPDGRELVYCFRYNDSHKEKDDEKKKEPPVYRHITRLFYRLDGAGFVPKDSVHIWKVAIDTGKSTQLTRGKYNDACPDVSPDGKYIAYSSNHSRNPDFDMMYRDLFIVPIKGGKPKRIPTPPGPVWTVRFSPDGKKIAYLGHDRPEDHGLSANIHVWTVGVSGRPAAKNLIPKFDCSAMDLTINDLSEGFNSPAPYWSQDSRRLYFMASDCGSTHLYYVPARGGLPTRVTHKNCRITEFSMNGKRSKIAAVYTDLKNPGDIAIMPPTFKGDTHAKILTSVNRELFSKTKLPATREIWFKAHDGFKLQGWLVTPPNFNRKRKYPAILEIHGGPRVQYGFSFFHEMLFLAAKGYVVFYTNPRGGGGRGETFASAIDGGWGEIDYYDCMSAADYLEKLPYVNSKRMGVTGGSYGGYMTNWIVGHTNRFRAAVTQRSVVNLKSFVGSSDFGYRLDRPFDGFPWQNPENYEKCSPLTYAENIKTPLLIIHSESDLRCSIEQAEQLFTTLKLMHKKVEFVRFPGEPHGLSRHGRPDRRLARLEWILKWFDRYLK